MLSQEKRNEIKELILATIVKTEEEVVELKELTKPIAPNDAIGRVSRMDAINNKSVNEAALRKTQDKLQKLNRALEKVNEEYFGLCGSCGNEIPIGRLMLMPESRFCVPCASRR